MKCVILAGGRYGDPEQYRRWLHRAELVVAADAGADFAWRIGVRPQVVVGDMDSVAPHVLEAMERQRVQIVRHPAEKDCTDTQLALALAEERGAREIVVMGWEGDRLDHVLSNLFSGVAPLHRGVEMTYAAPGLTVHLIAADRELEGTPGDLVSVVALSEAAVGVSLEGFQYPLEDATLRYSYPFAVSNRLLRSPARIGLRQGVLAVFHYLSPAG